MPKWSILVASFLSFITFSPVFAQTANNFQYFGYYFSAQSQFDLDPTLNHANVTVATSYTDLYRARDNNIKAILVLSGTFWTADTAHPTSTIKVLKPTWQADWQSRWQYLQANQLLDTVIGFYVIDEPDLFVNYQDFTTVLTYMKQTFTQSGISKPLLTILSPFGPRKVYLNQWVIPSNLDWIGFDEYNCFEASQCIDGISIPDKLDWLIEKKTGSQKVWAILHGFIENSDPNYQPTTAEQNNLNLYNRKIFSACVSRASQCLGVLGFFFPSVIPDTTTLHGTGSMPLVISQNTVLGQMVLAGNFIGSTLNLGTNRAYNQSVTASNTHPSTPIGWAVDNNLSTYWNSGGNAPQWIEINLGAEYQLSGINLVTLQSPSGDTAHVVKIAPQNHVFSTLTQFSQYTVESESLLELFPQKTPVTQYIRIETTKSPSWVGWRELYAYTSSPVPTNTPVPPPSSTPMPSPTNTPFPSPTPSPFDFDQDRDIDFVDFLRLVLSIPSTKSIFDLNRFVVMFAK